MNREGRMLNWICATRRIFNLGMLLLIAALLVGFMNYVFLGSPRSIKDSLRYNKAMACRMSYLMESNKILSEKVVSLTVKQDTLIDVLSSLNTLLKEKNTELNNTKHEDNIIIYQQVEPKVDTPPANLSKLVATEVINELNKRDSTLAITKKVDSTNYVLIQVIVGKDSVINNLDGQISGYKKKELGNSELLKVKDDKIKELDNVTKDLVTDLRKERKKITIINIISNIAIPLVTILITRL